MATGPEISSTASRQKEAVRTTGSYEAIEVTGQAGDALEAARNLQRLNEQPPDVLVVAAVRMALRALPSLKAEFEQPSERRVDLDVVQDLTLTIFLGLAFAWATVRFPGKLTNASSPRSSDLFARAPKLQTYTPSEPRAAHVISAARDAYGAAAAPATAAAPQAVSAIMAAMGAGATQTDLSADLTAASGGSSAAELAGKALWPKPTPDILSQWHQLKDALHKLDQDWEVWTEWYEARMDGRPTPEARELARARIPDETVAQGRKAVNEHIRKLAQTSAETTRAPGTARREEPAPAEREARPAGEVIFVGDAPKRNEDFLGRAELAFILAARLNRVWSEMNARPQQSLTRGLRQAWHWMVRRAGKLSPRIVALFLASVARRTWRSFARRGPGTATYDAGFVVHLDARKAALES
jgi:hypothetical protein